MALVAGIGLGVVFADRGTPGTVLSRTALAALPGWNGAAGTAELERDGDGRLTLVVDLDHRATRGRPPSARSG